MSTKHGILRELPPELAYLAEPAQRYGIHRFDKDIDLFLARAGDAELSELAAVAERVRLNGDFSKVNTWLDGFEIDQHEEVANLYFLFGLLEAADIKFEDA